MTTTAPRRSPVSPEAGNGAGTSKILEARGITKVFGGLVAVNSVDFDIPGRGIVSLIGPNGAGKTTFFNMVSGLDQAPSGGCVLPGRGVVRPSGPDGAGKTTFFNMVSGLYKPTSGSFVFSGTDVTRLGAHQRARGGVGRGGAGTPRVR